MTEKESKTSNLGKKKNDDSTIINAEKKEERKDTKNSKINKENEASIDDKKLIEEREELKEKNEGYMKIGHNLDKNEKKNTQMNKIMEDKFILEVDENSPFKSVTQTWVYCTTNDESEIARIPLDRIQLLKQQKSRFFKGKKTKNPELLFKTLGDKQQLISLYNDEEICTLYENRNNIV